MLEEFAKNKTPKGIGVDLVKVSKVIEMNNNTKGAFYKKTFTPQELSDAKASPDEATYLAGRFASKEAAFKAIAPLLPSTKFDLRIIETLKSSDGTPFINKTDELKRILSEAGINDLLVSISNEDDYVICIVHAY